MRLVHKYGGSSVATPEKIMAIARRLAQLKKEGKDLVVVCSAMGKTTNGLIALARQVNPSPSKRELDALLSTVKGPDMVGGIMQAAQDSARKTSEESRRTNYEKACAEAESAYAARNPHKMKKEG